MGHPRGAFSLRQLEKSELDVSFDREPGEHAAFLEDENAAWVGPAHCFAVDADFTAGRGKKAADGAQQRRFSATRGADDAEKLALRHVEIDVVRAQACSCRRA